MKVYHKHQKRKKKLQEEFEAPSTLQPLIIYAFIFSPFIWFILLKSGVSVNAALKVFYVRPEIFGIFERSLYISFVRILLI